MIRRLAKKMRAVAWFGGKKRSGNKKVWQSGPSITISDVLEVNERRIRQAFKGSFDLVYRRIAIGKDGCIAALVVHIDEMVNPQSVISAIVERIVDKTGSLTDPNTAYTHIRDRYLELTGVTEECDFHKMVQEIANGNTCIFIHGVAKVLVCETQGYNQREVSQPTTEATIRGSKEGFVEALPTNLSLIRRRIRNPRLTIEQYILGKVSRTPVALIYIEGIANSRIVEEARRRLSSVNIDSVQESGQLEELIEDAPLSPFPTLLRTERPDRVTGNLLEGRFAILTDGSPFALIGPATFTMFLTAPEDYFERFFAGSVIRSLRYVAFIISLTLPALYVAITTFHQELLPTPLILSIAAQRDRIPFPAVVEAALMEIAFELLREAGIRLPAVLGQAVSIIGALVIGEAALRAGLVSAAMVVAVALTGISSFATPIFSLAISIRLLRFPLMLLASALGLFGIVAGLAAMVTHLLTLRSFGVPYMEPLAPFVAQSQKDEVFRAPWWALDERPRFVGEQDDQRIAPGQMPRPPAPDETYESDR
ncbi:MAG: spore germination protein [Bacillota bacterium]|jgi:spore germination protein KA|nr:spore germination protein [Candidatus Fermentithermobacillaceae bacterium]